MTYGKRQPVSQLLSVLMTGALALSLTACEQPPSAEKIGRGVDKSVEKAGQKIDQGANTARKTIEQAVDTAGEKLAAAGQAVDNTTLEARVKAALIAAPGLKSSTINVGAADGVVTLAGTTEDATKRDLAGRIALSVGGVTSVRNDLVIATGS